MIDHRPASQTSLQLSDKVRRVVARTKERMIALGNYLPIDDSLIEVFAVTINDWQERRKLIADLPADQRSDQCLVELLREIVEQDRMSARQFAANLLLIEPSREKLAAIDDDGADADLIRLLE